MSYTDQPTYAPHPGGSAPPPVKGSNGIATAGFILALLGVLGSWIPVLNVLGILLGVVGVVLAAVGLAKSKKVDAGRGLALAGIVLGALAVVFAVLVNVVFVGAVDDAIDESTGTSVTSPGGDGGTSKKSGSHKSGAADAGLGATRGNPAPIGSTIKGGDWSVTVNSVTVVPSDSFGSKAASGSVLLSVNITATYSGDDEQGSTPWATVKFVAPDGTTVDSTSGSTLFIAENGFDSLATVYQGASVTGDQLLEVPAKNWQDGVLAVSPDMLSDDTFVAVG